MGEIYKKRQGQGRDKATFWPRSGSLSDPEVSVGGGSVVAEVGDEERLSVDDDDATRLDVVDPVERGDLLRTGVVQSLRKGDLAEVDVEGATPGRNGNTKMQRKIASVNAP